MTVLDHHKALSKAKIQLMAKPDTVFFTTVCFSLEHLWDDSISTACTDGKSIRFSPKFFMSLTAAEQVFLLIHESMHVAYLHMTRLNGRNPRKWNIAADYVINLQLVERGFEMPKCGLLDRQYAGMSTEQVYNLLPENPKEDCDMDIRPGTSDKAGEDQVIQEIQDILIRAQIQSKQAGDAPGVIPGDIQIFLDGLLNPKLPMKRILQKYINTFNKNDYSFKKLNRRFFPKYYLPSLYSQTLMDLTIALDTSGSVSDHDFHVFVSEVASIFRMLKPEKITLLQFDTELHTEEIIKSIKKLKECKFSGRGGTAIAPIIDWANKNKPELLLVFSDGEFRFREAFTKVPTIWLIHNNPRFDPPFGKTIHYSIEGK